jgi:hypothetical protein
MNDPSTVEVTSSTASRTSVGRRARSQSDAWRVAFRATTDASPSADNATAAGARRKVGSARIPRNAGNESANTAAARDTRFSRKPATITVKAIRATAATANASAPASGAIQTDSHWNGRLG